MSRPACFDQLRVHAASRAEGAGPAHDLLHVDRVVALAEELARVEGADPAVCGLAALLHELVNLPKSHPEKRRSGELCAQEAQVLLRSHGVAEAQVRAISYAIAVHPWSLGVVPETLEARVLQDADRLDALGAVGIARCFATCTELGRPFYHPDDPFCEAREPDDLLWGIDHFYRKLLKLPAGFHTARGRELGALRAATIEDFLRAMGRELRGGG